MPYKTGSWGKQAKARNKKRLTYFKDYQKKKYPERYTRTRYQYRQTLGMIIPKNIKDMFLQKKELKCQLCSYPSQNKRFKGLIIHHKNKDTTNNNFDNLLIVCRGCHNKIHKTIIL